MRTKLQGLAALYADGTWDEVGVRQSSERLKVQLVDIDHRLAEVNGIPKAVRTMVDAADVRGAWESTDITDRREIIRALAEVHIDPPGRGAVRFRSETVGIKWRR